MPTTTQSEKDAILLVHGTNAGDAADRGERWWQQGSAFWRRLRRILGDDFDCQPDGRVFHWSGLNSEKHRRAAAVELAKWIAHFEDAKRGYHLVGHSHGGSVLWRALQQAVAVRPGLPNLKSWSTIGTPFLHYAPRRVSLWWAALLLCALVSLIFVIPQVSVFREVIGEVRNDPSGPVLPLFLLPVLWSFPAILLFAILVRVGIFSYATVRTGRERREADAAYQSLSDRYVALWCEVDEAIGGLASTLGFKGPIAPRMRSASSSIAGAVFGIISAPIRLIYNDILAPASDEFIWDRITRRLQGNDLFAFDMVRVTRGPVPSFSTWPQLPPAISEELVKTANQHAATTLAAIRNVLGLVASSNSELPSIVTAIGAEIQNRELVHTLYYTNEDVCDILALNITRNIRPSAGFSTQEIRAWLQSGHGPHGLVPAASETARHERTGQLRAVQSLALAGILAFVMLTSSAIYDANIRPYSEQDLMRQAAELAVASPNISDQALVRWAASVTRAGFPDRALSAAGRVDTIKRRLLVMAAAAHELLATGEQVKARDVLDKAVADAKKSSPESNDAGFQATARELAHGGRLEEALQTVETLSQARDDWRAEGLREVAVGLAEAGEVEIAIKTLNSIPDIEKRSQQFQEFIRKGFNSASRARAIDALIEMAPKVPDQHNWRSGGLSAVSRSLTDQGEVDRALGFARSIPRASDRAGALDYIANKMISLGQFGGASAAIDDALSARPDGASYIAKTLARLGRLTSQNDLSVRAERMLEAAIVAAPPERQPFPDRAFGFIAADWAELGNIEKCVAYLARSPKMFNDLFFEGVKSSMELLAARGAIRRKSSM